jgi:hypothetical protein
MGLKGCAAALFLGVPGVCGFRKAIRHTSNLCSEAIVDETCQLFSGGKSTSIVTQDDLEEMLSASSGSVSDLFTTLGINDEGVSCEKLCASIVTALDKAKIKPRESDLGCYYIGDGSDMKCDVDLNPDTVVEETRFTGDLPDFNDGMPGQFDETEASEAGPVDYPPGLILRRAANLFRMYPPVMVNITTPTGMSLAQGTAEDWNSDLRKVNIKAMAYVGTAIRKFKARQTKDTLTEWYGRAAFNDNGIRREVLRIMNSVNGMLGNVQYVYPGPECSRNTYAYVYPKSSKCSSSQLKRRACTKNSNGQFIFYMCSLTLKSKLSVQIETLTHEGSHHASAYTDDFKYGRSGCKKLATEKPSKALKNADNFCYYIQDVTDKR